MKVVFSTEAVDLDRQAPNRNKRECKYFWDELYPLIVAGGFHHIEVPYEPKWDFGGRSGIPRTMRSIQLKYKTPEGYKAYLESIGISSVESIHLDSALFCAGAPEMYLGALGHFAEEALEFAAGLGCPVLTITVTPPMFDVKQLFNGREDMNEDVFLGKLADLITGLSQKAAEKNVTICIKNTYWGLCRGKKVFDFMKLLPESVKLDVDTAHVKIAGIDLAEFIKEAGSRIGIVHFTDTAFEDIQEAYRQPLPEFPAKGATKVFTDIGQGNVSFDEVLKMLDDVKYTGAVVYNCRNSYDVYRSILRTRRYINQVLVPNGFQED